MMNTFLSQENFSPRTKRGGWQKRKDRSPGCRATGCLVATQEAVKLSNYSTVTISLGVSGLGSTGYRFLQLYISAVISSYQNCSHFPLYPNPSQALDYQRIQP